MCFCCEEKCFQFRNTCFDHLCGNERFAFESWSYNIYLLTARANVSVQLLGYCLGEAPRGTRALGPGLQFLPQSCAHRGRAGWQLAGQLGYCPAVFPAFLLPTLTSRPVLAAWASHAISRNPDFNDTVFLCLNHHTTLIFFFYCNYIFFFEDHE